jgi:hypothetical protein
MVQRRRILGLTAVTGACASAAPLSYNPVIENHQQHSCRLARQAPRRGPGRYAMLLQEQA